MEQHLATRSPFDLDQSLVFMRRFSPCVADQIVDDAGFVTAVAVGDRAVAVRVAAAGAGLAITHVAVEPAAAATIATAIANLLGVDDDLAGFYRAAADDAPGFRAITTALHGLHHVRFPSLADIAVYAVLMQRTPIALAGRARQQVLARLGLAVTVGGATLRVLPGFAALVGLEAHAWRAAGVGARKAGLLPGVVRGVAALGEPFLREAPYAEARAALEAIHGIGPFSAAAILLRGLGRMDDVPLAMPGFAEPARAVYGDDWDPRATVRRYGPALGYWSYYLKTGCAR